MLPNERRKIIATGEKMDRKHSLSCESVRGRMLNADSALADT
jgi:hypothetical protein